MAQAHRRVLRSGQEVAAPHCRLRARDGRWLTFELRLRRFINPWTRQTC